LRLTPGLLIAQHAGGGKAEQIFLRGFDADHGTDVAISVDGLAPWLWADADLNLAHGRFRDEPQKLNRIPLAPEITSTGGLTIHDLGPVVGGMRYRYIGARAADQADSVVARGYSVVELFGTWQRSRVQLTVTVDNLLNTVWNEAQFATTSRLQQESVPVTELHFTPGTPRTVQVALGYRF